MTPEEVKKGVALLKQGIAYSNNDYDRAAYRLLLYLLEQQGEQHEKNLVTISASKIIPDDGKRWMVTDIIKSETLNPGDIVRMSEQPKDRWNVFVRESDYTIHSIKDKDCWNYLIVTEVKKINEQPENQGKSTS